MTDYPTPYGSNVPNSDDRSWVLPLLIAVTVGLLAIIVWLWFRCGDEPTVDWLINGARELPVRTTS